MEEEPGGRSHNYEFSHVAMRIKFLSHPEGLFELVSDEKHGADWLDWFWRRPVASNVEDAMRRSSGGLRLETGRFEGHQFALIVPPPPREAPGAYAIALVVDETTAVRSRLGILCSKRWWAMVVPTMRNVCLASGRPTSIAIWVQRLGPGSRC